MNDPARIQKRLELLCGVIASIQVEKCLVAVRSSSRATTFVIVDAGIIELGLRLGDAWKFSGKNEVHSPFGHIFRATHGCIIFPDDSLTPDFISLNFSAVSQKVSRQLWVLHDRDLIQILSSASWRALIETSRGRISLSTALELIEGWNSLKTEIDTIAYFHSIFLTTAEAIEFNKLYGNRSRGIIEKNPYSLLSVVSFARVDSIAIKHFEIGLEDASRTNAAICEILSSNYQKNRYFVNCSDLMNQIKSTYGFSDLSSSKAICLAQESGRIICKDGRCYSEGYFRIGRLIQRLVKSKTKLVDRGLISSSISLIEVSGRETFSTIMSITRHAKTYGKSGTTFLLVSSGGRRLDYHDSELKQISVAEFIEREVASPESSNLFIIDDADSLGVGTISRLLSNLQDEDSIVFLANPFSPNESSFSKFILEFQIPIAIIQIDDLIGSEMIPIQLFESSLDEARQVGHMLVPEYEDHESVAVNLWFFISTRWVGNCVIVSLNGSTHQETQKIARYRLNEVGEFNDLSRYHHSANVDELAIKLSDMESKRFNVAYQDNPGHHFSRPAIIDRTILILKTGDELSIEQLRNLIHRTKNQLIIVGDVKSVSHTFRIWNDS